MWLLLLATATSHAGCRGAIGSLTRSWSDLAVPVPTASGADLSPTAQTLADHGKVEASLKKSRSKQGRTGLSAALGSAETWMAANAQSLGVDQVKASIATVRAQCSVTP